MTFFQRFLLTAVVIGAAGLISPACADETVTIAPQVDNTAVQSDSGQSERAKAQKLIETLKAEHKPFYGAKITTLSNGMKVVVIENHRAPVLTHMIWYRVGGADEPVGHSGTAHFLEHLLFKGTDKIKPGEFSETIKNMGGRDNAFTSWDYTAFHETIPAAHVADVMRMEANRMRHTNPPHDHFLTERDVVLEERRQTLDNDPSARMGEQMRNALFVNHPYGRPIVGWMNEAAALDWTAIKAFYDKWYSPSNAILVVAGDVNAEEFFKLAENIYGQIEPFEVPQDVRAPRATFDTVKKIKMYDPLVKQRSFSRMTLTPTAAEQPISSLTVTLIGMMLDGGATSRLYKTVVVDQKKAVGAYFSSNSFARDYGTMSYGGTPVDGVSFDELEDAMLAVFVEAAEKGFTAKELERAKNRIIDAQIFELDSVTGPAMVFGRAMVMGINPDYLEYWSDALNAITLDEVNAKAKEILPRLKGKYAKTQTASPAWRQSVYGYLYPLEKPQLGQLKDTAENGQGE